MRYRYCFGLYSRKRSSPEKKQGLSLLPFLILFCDENKGIWNKEKLPLNEA